MATDSRSYLRILIADDEPNIRRTLRISLEADGHDVVAVASADDAIIEAGRSSIDLAFVDLRLGTSSGLDLLPRLLAESPWLQVVLITAHGSIDAAVTAMKRGAVDFVTKPFTPADVRASVERAAAVRDARRSVVGAQQTAAAVEPEAMLESSSPAMRRAVELARQVAASESTILLRGESGTGKGVIASAIHRWSERAAKPFTTVSCPSLSPTLLESELFGHVKGAFTGATRDHVGRIAIADGGTLFLDEIGDLPIEVQPKLLRFIQERQYERVGDTVTRRADVRFICATNANLEQAVAEKRFREDLLYRINVIQIDLPSLRDRPGDISPMAEQMLAFYRAGRRTLQFSADAMNALRQYRWPGNVRELRNLVERAVILCRADTIGTELLPAAISGRSPQVEVALGDPVPFEQIEAAHIRRILSGGKSLEDAATVLDIDVATLWRKRRKYGI